MASSTLILAPPGVMAAGEEDPQTC